MSDDNGSAKRALSVDDQINLFELPYPWEEQWQGMPEFVQGNTQPIQKITMNFESYDDAKKFGEIIGQRVTTNTDTLWFPKPDDYVAPKCFLYVDES